MRYGHFDDEGREYVVTTPRTPYPWINYLGSEEFFSLVSHTAGGYTFYRDARMRRLTRYRYNNIPNDAGGRYFYLNDGGDVWTPSWMPVKAELDSFEARHGMGYTRITGSRGGLTASVLYFVPLGRNAEVQQVTLTNDSDAAKSVGLFSFLEFALWNAHDDQTNYQRNLSLAEVEVELDGPHGSAIYHRTEYRERRDHYAVYGVNTRAAGFDTDRDTFVGAYNSLAEAAVPHAGAAANSVVSGWYPIGSHHLAVELAPGESRSFTFVLGYIENPRAEKWAPADAAAGIAEGQVVEKSRAHELLAAFATEAQTHAAFDELTAHWDRLLTTFTVRSSDEKLDRMVNIWNQYQCMVTFNMSRSASYFETGIGRGMGFRDSNQDLLGFVHLVPDRARERILDIAATQFPDGSAYHQYQPLTKRGNNDVGSGFNDDPLWLILGVAGYLKETGDWSILDEMVPFDNDEAQAASLFEHLTRSFEFTLANRGPARPAAHRPCGLERLPEPQLLLHRAGRVLPDDREPGRGRRGVGVHRGDVRGDRPRVRGHRRAPRPGGGGRPGRGRRCRTCARSCWPMAGTASGSCAPMTSTANRSAPDEDAEGRIWIEPQGMAVMGGIGLTPPTPPTPPTPAPWRSARWTRWVSFSAPTTAWCCSTRPTRATGSSSARCRPTRRATRRTAGSSATTTRG